MLLLLSFQKVKCFRVCYRFFKVLPLPPLPLPPLLLPASASTSLPHFYEKFFRLCLLKKSNASEFAAASFFKVLPLPQKYNSFYRCRFHIPASCFMKNTSVSGPSKSQMLPSFLPLPASFFKVFPLPQKFNRFYLSLPLSHP